MRRLIMIAVLLGCSAPLWAADESQVKQTIEEAQQAFDKAVALQGGWDSTAKLLKDALLSLSKGEPDQALALAVRARREAELSYTQVTNQRKNWSEPEYLRK